ncbi:amidophosphoribosyltransferase [Legionella sp. W05-934-2]|jgi:amidophosphoribosyltransferase|uniref:amidophosphoribosyltransferase n=1 Tax=Legionella sp. W05-934-2 TaxID=1198649 RepID=UPI003461A9F9
MCGIVAIYSHKPVAEELYGSLIHLQHRGQDAAGILTCQQRFHMKTGLGLVREVFNVDDMKTLKGSMGIAHTRYPTAGGHSIDDVQPTWVGTPRGIALAHNGNLLNYQELAEDLRDNKHRHLHSSTDSEVLLHLLAEGLEAHTNKTDRDEAYFDILCEVVANIYEKAIGSFSVVSIIMGKGILCFRDPHGIRPLTLGQRENPNGSNDYVIASETTMFYPLGYEPVNDIRNGELIFINQAGKVFRRQINQKTFAPCIFEYVYFARPDAVLDDVSVYRARLRMGQNLGKRWLEKYPDLLPDVIIPAPFTANTAAMAMAQTLGVPYSEGLYKNPFIGRTFIMPEGKSRAQHVRYKLIPQHIEIQNKNVLIVDDSIVRGTTSREIVTMVREHDAKAVYFASASPPIKEPCFYGIDIPSRDSLIAAKMDEAEIAQFLGVDALLYQTQEDLVEAVTRKGRHHIEKPCMACMNGRYITGQLSDTKKNELGDARKKEQV